MLFSAAIDLRLSGVPEKDRQVFSAFIAQGEHSLGMLPRRSARNEHEQRLADQVHASCRAARRMFMQVHGPWIYQSLTSGLTVRKRLDELVYAASDLVDGLVPTSELISRERTQTQKDKEGREIDQGIFFWGILRCARSGTHLLESMLLPTRRGQQLLENYLITNRADLGPVLLERRPPAAYLTIQNVDNLNAEDDELVEALETAVDLALMDRQSRVCVLRGATMTHPRYRGKRVFCPGINLRRLADGKISFVHFLLRRELGVLNKMRRGILEPGIEPTLQEALSKPWIVAIDSFAIGGGMQLALVADHVIAEEDSYLALPAAQEGIIPGAANLRLGKFTGARLARQIILCGRKLQARDPDATTLIDKVVPSAQMEAAIEESVTELSTPAVATNRMMLNLHEESCDQFRSYMSEFALQQALRMYSSDVTEKEWNPRSQSRVPR